jgi:hypothetical protein
VCAVFADVKESRNGKPRHSASSRLSEDVRSEGARVKIRLLISVLGAAWLSVVPTGAGAQEGPRTIAQYDREAGMQYVASWENGNRWGHGVILQGGYAVRACSLWGWQCQGIAEVMVTRFDYFDASYKQFALGVRYGKLMWPRIRTFAQFQAGIQNDGFRNSSNAAVFMPGVGFNYALTRRFDVQLLLDGPIANYPGGTYNQARLGIGVGVPLGSR